MCRRNEEEVDKRRLIGAVCLNHRIKRLVPCRCLDGHVEEPYEMYMALEARLGPTTSVRRHIYVPSHV